MRTFARMTVAIAAALGIGSANAALILPAPGTSIMGVPLSEQQDDAFVYSTRILDYFDPAAGWVSGAGTGNLDVIVTTRSQGQSNPPGFPAPVPNPEAANPINDSWGGTASSLLLVSTLLNYLQTTFNSTIPVFTFDQNETGGNPDLSVNAKVEIFDGVGGTLLKTWSLDATTQAGDGTYDQGSLVLAPGEITIPNVLNQNGGDCSAGATCTFSNNVGSGQFDYIIYVPTMDLTPWSDANNVFKVTWQFTDVDDGGEEITLFGIQVARVPEPGSLALLGLAGLGMIFARRRRQA